MLCKIITGKDDSNCVLVTIQYKKFGTAYVPNDVVILIILN